ncbi:MAG: hypothetical protein ACK5MZ_12385 [Aestuariibaculum sp.]
MNIKFLIALSFFVVLACNNKPNEVVTKDNSQELTEKEILKIKYTDYILDPRTEKAATDWNNYHQLYTTIEELKKGNLGFFKDNEKAVALTFKELKENAPKTLNTKAIMARILALETKCHKLENTARLGTSTKQELLSDITDVLIAFSNFNLQLNKKTEADNNVIVRP